MFKRIITLALAVVCLASFAIVGVSAAEAKVGDIVTYTATLTTPKNIENIQATTTYSADTLKLVDATVAERFPNMTGVVANAADGAVYFNASEISAGFDFTAGATLVTLQFEVLEHRLKSEYGVDIRRRAMPFELVRWVENEEIDMRKLNLTSDTKWVQDFKGNNLLLFTSEWCINWALQKNEGLRLGEFSKN